MRPMVDGPAAQQQGQPPPPPPMLTVHCMGTSPGVPRGVRPWVLPPALLRSRPAQVMTGSPSGAIWKNYPPWVHQVCLLIPHALVASPLPDGTGSEVRSTGRWSPPLPPRVLLNNSASSGGGGLTPPTHPLGPLTPPPLK